MLVLILRLWLLSCHLILCHDLLAVLFVLWLHLLRHDRDRDRHRNLLCSRSSLVVLVRRQDVLVLVALWVEWLSIDIVATVVEINLSTHISGIGSLLILSIQEHLPIGA